MKTIHIDTTENIDDWQKVEQAFLDMPQGKYVIKIGKPTRTNPQNRSIHKYCDIVAQEINNAGLTKVAVLSMLKSEMPWSMQAVKDEIWRPFQVHLGLPESTTKLKTNEIDKVYNLCNLFLMSKLRMDHIPFPSREEQALNNLLNNARSNG